MAFARTWTILTPSDVDLANILGMSIRDLREDIAQRFEIDHEMDDETDAGKHKKVTFLDPLAEGPAVDTDEGAIYTKDVASKAELFWKDEDANEIQITDAGSLKGVGVNILENDVALQGKETDDTVQDLVQVGDLDDVELGSTNIPTTLRTSGLIKIKASGISKKTVFDFGHPIMPNGYLSGYRINLIDPVPGGGNNDEIEMTAGYCMDSTNTVPIVLTSTIKKRLFTGWVVGSGLGGRASGVSLTVGVKYFFFVIMHADGTVDAGFDTSSSASALLSGSGYTYWRIRGYFTHLASSLGIRFNRGVYFGSNSSMSAYFQRSNIPITSSGENSTTHGLGALPAGSEVHLVNAIGELSWSVGDEIKMGAHTASHDPQPFATSSRVGIVRSSNAIAIGRKNTGAQVNITQFQWEWKFRGWTL